MNCDEHPQAAFQIEDRPAIGADGDRSPRQSLRRRRPQGDDQPRMDDLDFVQ